MNMATDAIEEVITSDAYDRSYNKGRADTIKKCAKEIEDILGSAYMADNLWLYLEQLKRQLKEKNKMVKIYEVSDANETYTIKMRTHTENEVQVLRILEQAGIICYCEEEDEIYDTMDY